jgi:hypothetical protein
MPLSSARASWLKPSLALSRRMFLAKTSLSGPLCVRFMDAIVKVVAFKATSFKYHSTGSHRLERFMAFLPFGRCGLGLMVAATLGSCVTTSMQGYADRQASVRPVQRIAVYVGAQGPLAASLLGSARDQAQKHGIAAEDASQSSRPRAPTLTRRSEPPRSRTTSTGFSPWPLATVAS